MKLAIYDKGSGGFTSNAEVGARSVLSKDAITVVDVPVDQVLGQLRTFSHIICHLNSKKEDEPAWPSLIVGDLSSVNVIIRVSSQGASGMGSSFRAPYRLSATGPWVLHLSERSAGVTSERWAQIFEALGGWDTTREKLPTDIAAIFNPAPEWKLALSILCETWLQNKGEESVLHGGVKVYAPTKPNQWFALFNGRTEGQYTPSNNAAVAIASQMGAAKDKAQSLLEKFAELWDEEKQTAKGNVTWAEFENPVRSLRDAIKNADK